MLHARTVQIMLLNKPAVFIFVGCYREISMNFLVVFMKMHQKAYFDDSIFVMAEILP